jgi:hypothetical protein
MKNMLAFVVMTVFAACNQYGPSGDNESAGNFDWNRFNQEKAAWEAQEITSYRFTTQIIVNYPVVPVHITVVPNTEPLLEFEPLPNFPEAGTDLEMATIYGKTIADVYTEIKAKVERLQTAYANEQDKNNQVTFTIRYNTEYHYPEYFVLSKLYDRLSLPGGRGGIEITDFEALDPR